MDILDGSSVTASFEQLAPGQLRDTLERFLPKSGSTAERIRVIEAGLESPLGKAARNAMARWIVDEVVPVDQLVPDAYRQWRPPVRDAMMFVVTRLSAARLAPKLLEQLELPPKTSAEERLLRLIAKVPGLQKLGQVIARNQHLHPALRRALARLENGIHDVRPQDVQEMIRETLGPRVHRFDVRISSRILKEASVSAVVRFSWRNPETRRRQRGVFKVLKPHIPAYFAEDMDYLQGLAQFFGDRHRSYGFAAHLIPDTFRKVRRLLRHEVNFAREQKTLSEASLLYRNFPGVRIPRVIRPLCASNITALTEEQGIKVTAAVARLPVRRRRKVAEQLVEALVAVPLFSSAQDAIFHGDPHAGNLLYNNRSGELVILDWALRERLSREQRRHLALLFLMVSLHDPVGSTNEVLALSQQVVPMTSRKRKVVFDAVDSYLDAMPASRMASGADAMRLLERVAIVGVRFPSSLIMLSKVMFTLEGILGDLVGTDTGMGFTIARHVAQHWIANRSAFRVPLAGRDWLSLQCSAMLYPSRVWLQWEHALLSRLFRLKLPTMGPEAMPPETRASTL